MGARATPRRRQPANESDPSRTGGYHACHAGRDHRNNVEQIAVDSPLARTLDCASATGPTSPGLLANPQPYSLAGDFDSRFYFTDWLESPGSVYEVHDGAPRALHRCQRYLYHSAFGLDGNSFYYSNANDTVLYRLRPGGMPEVFHRHTTYVREASVSKSDHGRVYFKQGETVPPGRTA